jgi:hypothetical protein
MHERRTNQHERRDRLRVVGGQDRGDAPAKGVPDQHQWLTAHLAQSRGQELRVQPRTAGDRW